VLVLVLVLVLVKAAISSAHSAPPGGKTNIEVTAEINASGILQVRATLGVLMQFANA